MRTINCIVVHCSATRENHVLTPEMLEDIHNSLGFRGTGYHYYIRKDGTVLKTRPIGIAGAHVRGHNAHSIGICYEGGLDARGHPKDTRTKEQRTALRLLASQLLKRFRGSYVCGHRDLSPDLNDNSVVEPKEWIKQCPCFDVKTEL